MKISFFDFSSAFSTTGWETTADRGWLVLCLLDNWLPGSWDTLSLPGARLVWCGSESCRSPTKHCANLDFGVWRMLMLIFIPRTLEPMQNIVMEPICFGAVFQQSGQGKLICSKKKKKRIKCMYPEILRKHLFPSVRTLRMQLSWIFQYDSDLTRTGQAKEMLCKRHFRLWSATGNLLSPI